MTENHKKPADRVGKKRRKRRKRLSRAGGILLNVMLVIALCLAAFSCFQIYQIVMAYKEGADVYENVASKAVTTPSANQSTDDDDYGDAVNWDYLYSLNADIAGWIYLPETSIDYPFVYGPDNSYYLYRLIDKTSNSAGTIFVDASNQRDFSDKVTVLYGHNMHNGSMFAAIEKYKNQSYYETHKVIYIETPSASYEAYPVYGYTTTGTDDYVRISFSSDESFLSYVEGFKAKSQFIGEQEITADDKLLLLSTCSYDVSNGRFALLCKLVETFG